MLSKFAAHPFLTSFALALVVLLGLHTEFSEPLLLLPQLGAALVLGVLYVGLELSLTRFADAVRRMLWAMIAAAIVSIPLLIPIWSLQSQLTHRRAERIISALDVYKQQRGRYPDSLAQLAPRYLPRVPSTAEGLLQPQPFRYYPDTATSLNHQAYWLAYYSGALVEASYASRSRQWHYED